MPATTVTAPSFHVGQWIIVPVVDLDPAGNPDTVEALTMSTTNGSIIQATLDPSSTLSNRRVRLTATGTGPASAFITAPGAGANGLTVNCNPTAAPVDLSAVGLSGPIEGPFGA